VLIHGRSRRTPYADCPSSCRGDRQDEGFRAAEKIYDIVQRAYLGIGVISSGPREKEKVRAAAEPQFCCRAGRRKPRPPTPRLQLPRRRHFSPLCDEGWKDTTNCGCGLFLERAECESQTEHGTQRDSSRLLIKDASKNRSCRDTSHLRMLLQLRQRATTPRPPRSARAARMLRTFGVRPAGLADPGTDASKNTRRCAGPWDRRS